MFRSPLRISLTAGGRPGARRRSGMAAFALLVCIGTTVAAGTGAGPAVTVNESAGVYSVNAVFTVPHEAALVLAALTDYTEIPRFMPEVRSSSVIERSDDRVVVEQEAIARFLLFSRKVHLVLEVRQQGKALRFRDRCGKSFTRYEGVWIVAERDGRTQVTYQLEAQPSFDVPEFLLKRLLKRDADRMIERLTAEIGARARTSR